MPSVNDRDDRSLAERLGYGPDARLVIINADDMGMCHASTQGAYMALREGIATTASVMIPCPWARQAARLYDGDQVGVHLTLNAEHADYRWGPVSHAPSLLGGDGGFPATAGDTWEHADLDEVRRECRAQIERALLWGFDVTHLDSHMGTLQLRPEFFDIYLDLAVEFRLPIRLTGAETEELAGFPFRSIARDEGVLFSDYFVFAHGRSPTDIIGEAMHDLKPGVTEFYLHPAIDGDEIRAIDRRADWRVADLEFLRRGSDFDRALADQGAVRIGWRDVREVMRAAS